MNNMSENIDENWKIFAEQSKFFWQFQQLVLIVETAIFSGWYKIRADSLPDAFLLQIGVLLVGIVILFVMFLIIRRASQYLEILRPSSPNPKNPLFGLKTNIIGVFIPILLFLFNLCLLFYTIIC